MDIEVGECRVSEISRFYASRNRPQYIYGRLSLRNYWTYLTLNKDYKTNNHGHLVEVSTTANNAKIILGMCGKHK